MPGSLSTTRALVSCLDPVAPAWSTIVLRRRGLRELAVSAHVGTPQRNSALLGLAAYPQPISPLGPHQRGLASAGLARLFQDSFEKADSDLFKRIFVELFAPLHASETVLATAMERTVPDSPNGTARRTQLWDAYEQAGLLLYSAEDHLRTVLFLFEGGRLPTYALYTLLRGAAVPVVHCAHLLDRNIDERTRLARALNARWDNLYEQNKLQPTPGMFAERIRHLDDRATANGITVLAKDRSRPEREYGERRLSEVSLFGRYLTSVSEIDRKNGAGTATSPIGEMVYRFLSGHVHALLWAKMVNAEVSSTTEPGMSSVKLAFQFDWFASMLLMVLRRHTENIKDLLRLSGYPAFVWEAATQTATERGRARYVELAQQQAKEAEKEP